MRQIGYAFLPLQGRKAGLDRSGYFSLYNANKFSLTLDLNHHRAQVVIKHWYPGAMF